MAKELIDNADYLKEVRNQYENYPYPPRNPEDEKVRFLHAKMDGLDCLNYYCYSGKKQFDKNFRVLIAGGGTGDAVISLGEQLRNSDAEIIYLDLSKTSMEIAKKRADVRKLTNIKWLQGSLLDVAELGIGKFDYINCSGVLHHLESPDKGLAALSSVLKDDGVMAIMVYGQYGRTGIYHMQDLMRILNEDEQDMQQKIDNCKAILSFLPESNWFVHTAQCALADIQLFGGAGIYDLLLHSQDRAYTVPQIYDFLDKKDLNLIHFFFDDHIEGNNLYKIESYTNDENLIKKFKELSLKERQAAAELLSGSITKHIFYAMKHKPQLPTPKDLNNVPFLSFVLQEEGYNTIYEIARSKPLGGIVSCQTGRMIVEFRKTKYCEAILKYLDGNRSLKEIFDNVKKDAKTNHDNPTYDTLISEFENIFAAMERYEWMFLRDKSVPPMPLWKDLQNHVTDMYRTAVDYSTLKEATDLSLI